MSAHQPHEPAPADFNKAFAVGIVLNIAFVAIEAFYGWKVDSLTSKLRPNLRHTCGWQRGTTLAAFANALLLLVAMGALTLWMGWSWLDPVTSLVIAIVILVGTGKLFKQSLHLLFDGVPNRVDLQAVRDCLAGLPGVSQVNDLHIWAMSTNRIALTAHLVMPGGAADDAFLKQLTALLHVRFDIGHVTVQTTRSGPDGAGAQGVNQAACLE